MLCAAGQKIINRVSEHAKVTTLSDEALLVCDSNSLLASIPDVRKITTRPPGSARPGTMLSSRDPRLRAHQQCVQD